jgi:hypothetical protein
MFGMFPEWNAHAPDDYLTAGEGGGVGTTYATCQHYTTLDTGTLIQCQTALAAGTLSAVTLLASIKLPRDTYPPTHHGRIVFAYTDASDYWFLDCTLYRITVGAPSATNYCQGWSDSGTYYAWAADLTVGYCVAPGGAETNLRTVTLRFGLQMDQGATIGDRGAVLITQSGTGTTLPTPSPAGIYSQQQYGFNGQPAYAQSSGDVPTGMSTWWCSLQNNGGTLNWCLNYGTEPTTPTTGYPVYWSPTGLAGPYDCGLDGYAQFTEASTTVSPAAMNCLNVFLTYFNQPQGEGEDPIAGVRVGLQDFNCTFSWDCPSGGPYPPLPSAGANYLGFAVPQYGNPDNAAIGFQVLLAGAADTYCVDTAAAGPSLVLGAVGVPGVYYGAQIYNDVYAELPVAGEIPMLSCDAVPEAWGWHDMIAPASMTLTLALAQPAPTGGYPTYCNALVGNWTCAKVGPTPGGVLGQTVFGDIWQLYPQIGEELTESFGTPVIVWRNAEIATAAPDAFTLTYGTYSYDVKLAALEIVAAQLGGTPVIAWRIVGQLVSDCNYGIAGDYVTLAWASVYDRNWNQYPIPGTFGNQVPGWLAGLTLTAVEMTSQGAPGDWLPFPTYDCAKGFAPAPGFNCVFTTAINNPTPRPNCCADPFWATGPLTLSLRCTTGTTGIDPETFTIPIGPVTPAPPAGVYYFWGTQSGRFPLPPDPGQTGYSAGIYVNTNSTPVTIGGQTIPPCSAWISTLTIQKWCPDIDSGDLLSCDLSGGTFLLSTTEPCPGILWESSCSNGVVAALRYPSSSRPAPDSAESRRIAAMLPEAIARLQLPAASAEAMGLLLRRWVAAGMPERDAAAVATIWHRIVGDPCPHLRPSGMCGLMGCQAALAGKHHPCRALLRQRGVRCPHQRPYF